jgi:ERCC4-type nuclease
MLQGLSEMSESNGRCEFESQDYCCISDEYKGYNCRHKLPIQPGEITNKCGATDADLMTEEEWEAQCMEEKSRMNRDDREMKGCKIIIIDSREQTGEYMKSKFDSIGVESEVCCLPYQSGADYYISQTYGSCGVQRKNSMAEICGTPVSDKFNSAMEELIHGIIPRLISYTDNPILLVEESHMIGDDGYLFRKEGSMYKETQMHSSSYYGFLETCRMMGVNVVCVRATPDLMPTIYYLAAMDGYLAKQHYPKHLKSFKIEQQCLGMLAGIPGIGIKRAEKALIGNSIKDLMMMQKVNGLTEKQLEKVKKVLCWRG